MSLVSFSNLGKNGRLGNQLFQIAATLAFAFDTKRTPVFPEWSYSKFMEAELPTGEIKKPLIYYEPAYHYHPIPRIKGDIDLHGYFQSYKYFEHQWENIKEYFTYNRRRELINSSAFILDEQTCSIHVRRGDYLGKPQVHVNQTALYYLKAIEKIYGETPKDVLFVFFSDDIGWCKESFDLPNMYFSDCESEIADLYLMSLCDNNIIANSSFSWWGAWLNENPYKKVVAPKEWFGPALKHNTKDLIPANWVTI